MFMRVHTIDGSYWDTPDNVVTNDELQQAQRGIKDLLTDADGTIFSEDGMTIIPVRAIVRIEFKESTPF